MMRIQNTVVVLAIAAMLPLTAVAHRNSATNSPAPYVIHTSDDRCTISIDTSAAPELADWAEHKLAPVLAALYPKIVALLPTPDFTAPPAYSITIQQMDGVAYTSGTKIFVSDKWIHDQMNGEAIGSIVHETVHVIQQYHGFGPAWLIEGIADYVRWFKYEPESHGADIVWMRTLGADFSPRYDASYRVSANFLNWVSTNYDSNIVAELNSDLRQKKYSDDFWKQHTRKSVQELGEEWKQQTEAQLHTTHAPTGR